MPKTRKRKKATTRKNTPNTQGVNRTATSTPLAGATPVANRRFVSPPVRGPQSLAMPVMVALGCWGFAFFFLFMYPDPNHVLYGGMAIVMALLWTFSAAIRVRKLLSLRQQASQMRNA